MFQLSKNGIIVQMSQRRYESFAPGAIVRMKIKDFLTYDEADVYPGPRLNCIIGPNGTGKSTIVCAICLTLGGTPEMLGRQSSMLQYIKFGKTCAIVEIELKGKDASRRPFNPVIKMSISSVSSTHTTYHIDSQRVSKDKVIKLAAEMDIQVNNPCQFLPQDKVVTFSQQDPELKLENTEKALDGDLFLMHQNLKSSEGQGDNIRKQIEGKEKDRDGLAQSKEELEPQVRAYKQREDCEKNIKIIETKIALLHYETYHEKHRACRQELADLKEEKAKLDEPLQPMNKKIKEIELHVVKIDESIKEEEAAAETKKGSIRANSHQIDNLSGQLEDEVRKLQNKKAEQDTKRRNKEKLEVKLRDACVQAENTTQVDNTAQIKKCDNDIANIQTDLESQDNKVDKLNNAIQAQQAECADVERDLRFYKERETNRLEPLGRLSRNAKDVYEWYLKNKHHFKGRVYVPLVEIQMKDRKDAKYVESIVGQQLLECLVCENKEDEENLHKLSDHEFRKKMIFNSSTINAGSMRVSALPDEFRTHGYDRTVYDLFEAPERLMKFLVDMRKIDKIPVGDAGARTNRKVGRSIDTLKYGISKILCNDESITITKSRYSGHKTLQFSTVREGRYLTNKGVDLSAVPKLEAERNAFHKHIARLENEKKPIEDEIQSLNALKQTCSRKRSEYIREQRQKQQMENVIQDTRAQIEQVASQLVDVEKLDAAFQKKLEDIMEQKFKYAKKSQQIMNDIEKGLEKRVGLALKHASQANLYNRLLDEKERTSAASKKKDDDIAKKKEEIKEKAAQVHEAMKRIVKVMRLPGKFDDQQNKNAITEAMAELDVKNAAELIPTFEKDLAEEKGKLLASTARNPDVVERYEKMQTDFEKVERELRDLRKQDESYQRGAAERREAWLTPLRQLINDISKNFGKFFLKIDCVGEILLLEPQDPNAFKEYGIDIKVKFREDDEMRTLNNKRQSGGERSVTTILYILALQEKARVPFRVIDEINQGMDPTNERAVFEMMVQLLEGGANSATNLSKAQYFMLTPKLLDGLYYSRAMTIQIIHNGPHAPEPRTWSISDFLKTAKTIKHVHSRA